MIKLFLILGHLYALPPCVAEDSDNCYWDARTMGNRQGDSFVTISGFTHYAFEEKK